MPEKQPSASIGLDLSHLSNAVKALKKPTKASNTSQSVSVVPSIDSPIQGTAVGSKMSKSKKGAPTSEERILAAIEKGIQSAITQINRKLATQLIRDHVRRAINEKYHDRLTPEEINGFSKNVAQQAGYELGNLEFIPEEFLKALAVETPDALKEAASVEDFEY